MTTLSTVRYDRDGVKGTAISTGRCLMAKGYKQRKTIHDVAAGAGVSMKTVSRVFNSEPKVRQATRDKVLAAARSLGYAPNISARRLAARRSFIVGLLYRDDDVNHYIPDVQHGALDACRDRGYNLLLHPCQGEVADAALEIHELARQALLDGFIVTPPLADSLTLLNELKRIRVPFVRVSQLHRGKLSPSVAVADRRGAYRMTEYLASLGHRKIAFIVGSENQGASVDRLQGFRDAVEKLGLEHERGWVRQGDFTFESGSRSMTELLALKRRPTAVFASNDDMAAGALLVAHRHGYDVPGDISIVGFDDIAMTQRLWPPLTTVRQPTKKAAFAATMLLLDGLASGDFAPKASEIETELVIRESAGPCRPARGPQVGAGVDVQSTRSSIAADNALPGSSTRAAFGSPGGKLTASTTCETGSIEKKSRSRGT
jgi:LacI family transcriptional regulator